MATATLRKLILATLLSAVPLGLAAQEMPTFKGKGKVTAALNTKLGAVFDIGAGVTMLFPKGLPVGESRLVTLRKARKRPPLKLIGKSFKPLGPALDFNGAFTAPDLPMILALSMKKDPSKPGKRLVVAMEIGTFCEGPNKRHKLKSGLCTGFELHDAEYDSSSKRLRSELRSTGGLRMQFGLVNEGDE